MRRSGNSLFLVFAFALAASLCAASLYADKKPKNAGPYGVVGGTVFRESGYALRGAEVVLSPDRQPGQDPVKIRSPKAISDGRGEFAFRVPVSAMRYTVSAHLKGFEPRQKSVDIEGEQRVDVTLVLPAVSK